MPKPLPWLTQESLDNMKVGLDAAREEHLARMSESVPPPTQKSARSRTRKQVGYPWELWTNGEWHDAYRGDDYTCSIGNFRAYLYRYAQDHDLYVRSMLVDRDSGYVSFQFATTPFPSNWRHGGEPLG